MVESRELPQVEMIELPRQADRPSGRRFGSLVHAVLASVPLDANLKVIQRLASTHGRILGCPLEEQHAAAGVVQTVLAHPVLQRARDATARNECRREVPVSSRLSSAGLIEGVIDLAFLEDERWVIVDFKTDDQLTSQRVKYEQQLRAYATAMLESTRKVPRPILMRL
jgi:ATP-dependent helicase/nuclease subunit A